MLQPWIETFVPNPHVQFAPLLQHPESPEWLFKTLNDGTAAACVLWGRKPPEEHVRQLLRVDDFRLNDVANVGFRIQDRERDAGGRRGYVTPFFAASRSWPKGSNAGKTVSRSPAVHRNFRL